MGLSVAKKSKELARQNAPADGRQLYRLRTLWRETRGATLDLLFDCVDTVSDPNTGKPVPRMSLTGLRRAIWNEGERLRVGEVERMIERIQAVREARRGG
jgi:hypothetical protein